MIITAYRTWIQLAILDHNAQLDHSPKLHSETHAYQYHRRYRKQTCNWDVVQVKQAKDYKYIPARITHPMNIQPTIAHIQPPDTATIFNKKRSRF